MKMHKVIEHENVVDFERELNEFGKTHQVFATQTHVNVLGTSMIYTAVIYYNADEGKKFTNSFEGVKTK